MNAVVVACGGSPRAAIRALLIANEYLNAEVERLRASADVSIIRPPRGVAAVGFRVHADRARARRCK